MLKGWVINLSMNFLNGKRLARMKTERCQHQVQAKSSRNLEGLNPSISAEQAPEQAPAFIQRMWGIFYVLSRVPVSRGTWWLSSVPLSLLEVSRVATGNQNAWLEISGGLEVRQVLYSKFCLVPTSATSQNWKKALKHVSPSHNAVIHRSKATLLQGL